MTNRLLSTLGICKKAGRLVMGADAVTEAAALGGIALILLCEDLSPKSAKNMAFVANKHNIAICTAPIRMDEIWHRLGKRSGIIGVADQGLAGTVSKTVRACMPEAE